MKGPEQEREPKYQEVGLGKNWKKKKRFKQTLRIKGQEGDDLYLTENKCLFLWIEK